MLLNSPLLTLSLLIVISIMLCLFWGLWWREKSQHQHFMQEIYELTQEVVRYKTLQQQQESLLVEKQQQLNQVLQETREEKERYAKLSTDFSALETRVVLMKEQTQQQDQTIQKALLKTEEQEQQYRLLMQQKNNVEQHLTKLQTTLVEKEKNLAQQAHTFLESKQALSIEFQNLANKILEEKTQRFSQTNQMALDTLLKPFREQLEHFQKRVNDIHTESVKGNAGLEAEIKKVLDIGLTMSQEAGNLTSALKGNKKILGNWGEMQLERSLQLSGLIPNEHYTTQENFKSTDGSKVIPDFVVLLPDNKHLVIDSKVSLIAYEKAVVADNEPQMQAYLKEHIQAIRNHIDQLSSKDYSNAIGIRSPSFVLIFIPIEPAYLEAMKFDPNLYNYAYQKNIILVSHTTLMPILRTVANLWRIERGNQEALEISSLAGDIYNNIGLLAERLTKVGANINTLTKNYNDSLTSLVGNQGLVGKVERFKALSTKANRNIPQMEPLYNHAEEERLSLMSVTDKEVSSTTLHNMPTSHEDS